MLALYATIWISLGLFVVGEWRPRGPHDGSPPGPAWWASAAGAVLLAVHIALSMWIVHGWSHESAMTATALQTRAVYGVNWGGGVFVNYLFLAVWMAELIAWRLAPARYASRSRALSNAIRAFFFVIIANAAVIFAAGWRRALGVALILVLADRWRRRD